MAEEITDGSQKRSHPILGDVLNLAELFSKHVRLPQVEFAGNPDNPRFASLTD
jgi:hypothetical protein